MQNGFAISTVYRSKRQGFPTSYKEAKEMLGNRDSKKLANNTYLVQSLTQGWGPLENGEWGFSSDAIAVRLHNTEIVVFHPNGRTTLNTGGWQTPTTRERMRACGFPVYMTNGIAEYRGIAFVDGMTIGPRGGITGGGVPIEEAIRKRRRALRKDAMHWRWPNMCGGRARGGNAPEAFKGRER